MTKVWNGPTPYDADLANLDPKQMPGTAGATLQTQLIASAQAHRAAMNSPEVVAMYEALLLVHSNNGVGMIQRAIDAYETGLREVNAHDGQE